MRKRVLNVLILIALLGLVVAGCLRLPTAIEFKPEAPSSAMKEAAEEGSEITLQPPSKGSIEGYEIYENKDPFQPLTGPGAEQAVTTTTVPTPTGLARVTLVSIASDGSSANFTVDGTNYSNVKVGDTFASYFKLISISTGSVVILYGDSQYTLYLGETLTLK